MSDKIVLDWLKLSDYLKAIRAIENSPKTSSEIARMINVQETRCAEILENLESVQAITYTGNGWGITPLGKQVLNKYFK